MKLAFVHIFTIINKAVSISVFAITHKLVQNSNVRNVIYFRCTLIDLNHKLTNLVLNREYNK